MSKTKFTSLSVFGAFLLILVLVAGLPWSVAHAGYIDEPVGSIENSITGGTVDVHGGSVEFGPTSCLGHCVVRDVLPSYSLPIDGVEGDIFSRVYVRQVDSDGNPAPAPYTVCFDAPGNLYKYEGGAWVQVGTSSSESGQVCYSTSGEGAFIFTH